MRRYLLILLLGSLVSGCGAHKELTQEDAAAYQKLSMEKRQLTAADLRKAAVLQQRAGQYLVDFIAKKVEEKDYDFFFRAVPAGAFEQYPLVDFVMTAPSVPGDPLQNPADASRYASCHDVLAAAQSLYFDIRETQPPGILDLQGNGAVNMRHQQIRTATEACTKALEG